MSHAPIHAATHFLRRRLSADRRWPRALLLSSCVLLLAWSWQSAPPTLTRGPYLQDQGTTSITVVYRTSSSASTTVRYGPNPGFAWESSKASPAGTTHAVALTGLRPDTKYYYQVESGGAVIAGGAESFFHTSPPANGRTPFRFMAWGDSGTGSSSQRDVARRMEQVVPQPDFALGLGDLVYDAGEWENYDPRLFRPYARIFARMTFWPTLGNHDYMTQSGAPYLDAFYLPTRTGAPGHPSNTEKYYSFDQGMAHFVCADSESSSNDPGSAMYTWISDDLDDARAHGKRWLFVFMHHPPYSHGTHDSDVESELITLRQNLVPLFEAKGVDLVMVGHSHVYERSYLARNGQVLQNDPGDYAKIGTPNGTLYLVSGCGGETGTGSLDHPLMAVSKGDVAGFNLIDVSWEDVRGSFVEADGRTTDLFRLHKSADTQPPRVLSLRSSATNEVQLVFDEPVRAGTGATGAENPGNYQMRTAAVRSATLASDERTVTLSTTNLEPGRGYPLYVMNVADLKGNVAQPQQTAFVSATQSSGGGGAPPLVTRGTTWRYLAGTSAAPSSWTGASFGDSGWSQGGAAFGYGYGHEGTLLADMKDGYATVYMRQAFDVIDPGLISRLMLDVAFDDGFVAYLNGREVARGNMPAGAVTHTTLASSSHEEAGFEPFDVTASRSALVAGRNVLAIEGHNFTLGSPDFWLDLELVPTLSSGGGGGNPPIAVLDSAVQCANSPARIDFSAALSRDPDGGPLGYLWDFGDGTWGHGPVVQHTYVNDGTYVVTLGVRDRQLLDALERRTLRIHSIGDAPQVQLTASQTQVGVGTRVAFDSAGSVDPDGGALYAYWDFGDPLSGEANHSTAAASAHTFARSGTFVVRLALTDDEGSTATRTVTVTVR